MSRASGSLVGQSKRLPWPVGVIGQDWAGLVIRWASEVNYSIYIMG